MREQPIGVIDSGRVLAVLSALTRHMPAEDWLVLQDNETVACVELADKVIIARTMVWLTVGVCWGKSGYFSLSYGL